MRRHDILPQCLTNVSKSDGLSERARRDGGGRHFFSDAAKIHDGNTEDVAKYLVGLLSKENPHLEFSWKKKLTKIEINEKLSELHPSLGSIQFNIKSHILPDGGIIEVKGVDGKFRVVLISEAKVQGTNGRNIQKGFPWQSSGNVIERALKNIAEARNYMLNENHFPYVLFGHGDDLAMENVVAKTTLPIEQREDPTKQTLPVGYERILKPTSMSVPL